MVRIKKDLITIKNWLKSQYDAQIIVVYGLNPVLYFLEIIIYPYIWQLSVLTKLTYLEKSAFRKDILRDKLKLSKTFAVILLINSIKN